MTDATDTLRPIEPLPDCRPDKMPELGRKPELLWVAPTDLWVDDEYQRDLNVRSFRLIKNITAEFAWRKVKPPIVVRVGKRLHVIDGQHTAIAAATLELEQIPVFLVGAASDLERADAFVAHNMNRLTMQAMDVYRAQVKAGNPVALSVATVLTAAGCRLRANSRAVKARVGDTAAVSQIKQMVLRRGAKVATQVLRAFVTAGAGPISSAEIAAAEVALCVPHGGNFITEGQLSASIKKLGPDGVMRCGAQAINERVATKVVLAREYRRLLSQAA